MVHIWRVFENLKLAVKQCYQTKWKVPNFKNYLVAMRNGGLDRYFVANFVGDDFTGRACRRSVSVMAIPMVTSIPCISFGLGLSFTSPPMAIGSPVGVMTGVRVVVSRVRRLADLLFHGFTFLCIGDFNVGTTYFFVAGVALFVRHL